MYIYKYYRISQYLLFKLPIGFITFHFPRLLYAPKNPGKTSFHESTAHEFSVHKVEPRPNSGSFKDQ